MPHLVMEYSNSIEERVNVQALLQDLHQVAIDSGLFDTKDIKSRTLRTHHWLIGELEDSVDFIHVSFELLDGRSLEQKQALSLALIQALQEKADFVASLTVNIRDMEKATFQKVTHI